MSKPKLGLPPEVRRFSGLYRFIPPEQFESLGIDHEDVPLGTFPAEDHPPFLPDRFGGNAYGLGLFEQSVLPEQEAGLLEAIDLTEPDQVAAHYRDINDIFKRLGLLIRYTRQGRPFYLIPRQFVAHFLVEVQARADVIVDFLVRLLSRSLRESLRVGMVAVDNDLLLPEIQARMPQVEFLALDSLAALTTRRRRPLQALIMVGDPRQFALDDRRREGLEVPRDREGRDAYGYFMVSRFYDLLDERGEVMVICDRPLGSSRETVHVTFKGQDEFKRFLLFSHVYRTRRRYTSREGMTLGLNRFDFNAFLTGLGVYHETVEGMLGGRSVPQVVPPEIDALPYQDLPLPRGSAPRLVSAFKRWFGPFFEISTLTTNLPEAQRHAWEDRYRIDGELPHTLVVLEGRRRQPPISLVHLESQAGRRHLVGCSRELLAGYKDSLAYVQEVLAVLERVRAGDFTGLPGLELSRLRKPFEAVHRHEQIEDVVHLMEMGPRLKRLEGRLNPQGLMGGRTPVLANLEKLALMGAPEGPLGQLYLIVLGHSTMARVTFGKLPETTLRPLTDINRYHSLEEAITVIRLYRLLSVAEAAAASDRGLSREQVEELFDLYDNAVRVVTDTDLDWSDVLDDQISRLGGVQAMATRKMLKLFDLFEHMERWRELEGAGPRAKEALADFDPMKLSRIQAVIDLTLQVKRFVGRFYAGDSSARPYFFRALLNCEMHGTGRLLPELGTPAGFALLWICVHTSERRLINFNRLMDVESERLLPQRLEKLRRALLSLTPEQLSPQWLAHLRETMTQRGEAYVRDSGLYLSLDPVSGALTPRFIDVLEELALLKQELNLALGRPLHQVPDERLGNMDRRCHAVGRFIQALKSEYGAQPAPVSLRPDMADEHAGLQRQFEHYLLEQIYSLPVFAANLHRLADNCPRLLERLLPQGVGHPQTLERLAAADKLSALHQRRLDSFQDMKLSHEMARAQFGPAAAGIVGVTPLQFQSLTGSLAQLLHIQPRLGTLLMLAVTLYDQQALPGRISSRPSAPLAYRLELAQAMHADLDFLLEHHGITRQVVLGEAPLAALQPVLDSRDPPLIEALFLLGVITAASRQEGFLTEDLQERFFDLQDRVRRLLLGGRTAPQAMEDDAAEHARRHLAFERYLELQRGEAPTAGLRQMLENESLPDEGREEWLSRGRLDAGLDRLLALRGLAHLSFLDMLMLRHGLPVAFIYRQKAMRSLGATQFERDLYEGLRLYRGLTVLRREYQGFLLNSLADPGRQVFLQGFNQAAERLTYPNQVRLLLLGLAAAAKLEIASELPLVVSFQPLARVMETKFEVVNEVFGALDPGDILNRPRFIQGLVGARQGLTLAVDAAAGVISVDIADLARIDRRIEAVRRALTPVKLKRIYHQELKRLKLTAYHTLDFQQRLEAAYNENLERQAEDFMERTRLRMAEEDDLDNLLALFQQAWEEGLELPLSQDRQQSLRDLYELNLERIRAKLLDSTLRRLAQVDTFPQLDELWQQVRQTLAAQRRHLGKDFDLLLADRFDQRAQELRGRVGPSL